MSRKIYGGIHLLHGYCSRCDDTGYMDTDRACLDCGTPMVDDDPRVQRMSRGPYRRKKPSAEAQEYILEAQGDACYWCGREFGGLFINSRGRVHELRIRWDHYVPYSFTGSCVDDEFVAACQVCNGIKRDLVLEEDQMRSYINGRIRKRGYTYV